jgi:hypothetical protein
VIMRVIASNIRSSILFEDEDLLYIFVNRDDILSANFPRYSADIQFGQGCGAYDFIRLYSTIP